MRVLRRAAVATVTAGSLMFLGAGVAYADTDKDDKKADKKVTIFIKDVTQVCENKTEKQKIVAHHNKNSAVGSNFICTQTVRVG